MYSQVLTELPFCLEAICSSYKYEEKPVIDKIIKMYFFLQNSAPFPNTNCELKY